MKPKFRSLLFSYPLDTWLTTKDIAFDDLVDGIYSQLLGHELKRNSSKTRDTLKVVLLNLYSTYLTSPKLYISYSRDENYYNSSYRYVSRRIHYSSLVGNVIPALIRLELIEHHIGWYDKEFGKGYQSRMKATLLFTQLIDHFEVEPSMLSISKDKEIIRLKDEQKKLINYEDTPFTNEIRSDLQFINRHLLAHTIDLAITQEQMKALLERLKRANLRDDEDEEDRSLSFFTRKSLYRIFSNSRWDHNGRFYGAFWQNIPKDFREYLTIDGHTTVELDFSATHPRMLHDTLGIELTSDPYTGIGSLSRSKGKSIVGIMLNANSRKSAAKAYRKKHSLKTLEKAEAVVDMVLEHHSALEEYFFTGIGREFMFYDAQIANNVMIRAITEYETVLLPIHDSFVCLQGFEDNLKQLMEEEYMKVMSAKWVPKIDRKDSSFYLTDLDRLLVAEYGEIALSDHPVDKQQAYRHEQLTKQAKQNQREYRIHFEDVFTAEELDAKYSE